MKTGELHPSHTKKQKKYIDITILLSYNNKWRINHKQKYQTEKNHICIFSCVRACDVGCSFMHTRPRARLFSSAATTTQTTSTGKLSHINDDGSLPTMVDVGHKTVTSRTARARSIVDLPEHVFQALAATSADTDTPGELSGTKGPIITTAIIAGVMGAKKTSELIPFCHPLMIDNCTIDISVDPESKNDRRHLLVDCQVKCKGRTGVEMEALTGATVASLCVYDMCKALSHDIRIKETSLVSKTGGKKDI